MKKVILSGVVSLVVGILLALFGQIPIKEWLSSRIRQRASVPEIMRTVWQAEWHLEDGSLYAKDTVTFEKWTKNSQFEGYGDVTYGSKQYRYSISGEVSPARVVVLTYKAQRFPTESNIGMACLQLSTNAEGLSGTWAGLLSAKESDPSEAARIRGGKVSMTRIRDLNP